MRSNGGGSRATRGTKRMSVATNWPETPSDGVVENQKENRINYHESTKFRKHEIGKVFGRRLTGSA